MSILSKSIAFVAGKPYLVKADLLTMPFGLNVVLLLDRMGYNIDLYLLEEGSEFYQNIFSDRVHIRYLNNKHIWMRSGRINYHLLTNYVKVITLGKVYDLVFGTGQAGVVLGSLLKRSKNAPFIYMNDEFPELYKIQCWLDAEMKSAMKASIVVVPDECRISELQNKVPGITNKPVFVLPNAPLISDLTNNLPIVNWHAKFNISPEKKIFLNAGGIFDFNQIAELLFSVAYWPEDAVLLVKSKSNNGDYRRTYAHLDIPGKIIWDEENYSPDMLHSLIKYCYASFGLYRNMIDNLKFMGKSSGKLMRALALGSPVIASRDFNLDFIDENKLGVLVGHPKEIANAVKDICDNQLVYKQNINEYYFPNLSYENYWEKFVNGLQDNTGIKL